MLEQKYNCDIDTKVPVFIPKGVNINISQKFFGGHTLSIESRLITSVVGGQSFFTSVSN